MRTERNCNGATGCEHPLHHRPASEKKPGKRIGEKSARKTAKGAALRVCLVPPFKIEKPQPSRGTVGD